VSADALLPTLKELHTLGNAIRHGEGRSLNGLFEIAPSLWPDSPHSHYGRTSADRITIGDEYFLRYAAAIATFWGRGDRLPGAISEVGYSDIPTLLTHYQTHPL
jgi:hypothetical protein